MAEPALPVFAADKGSSSTPRNGPISLRRGAARRSPGSGSSPAAPSRPLPKGPVAMAAGSPLTVAGAAPVLHRTSLSRRKATLARPPVYRLRAPIPERPVAGTPDPQHADQRGARSTGRTRQPSPVHG